MDIVEPHFSKGLVFLTDFVSISQVIESNESHLFCKKNAGIKHMDKYDIAVGPIQYFYEDQNFYSMKILQTKKKEHLLKYMNRSRDQYDLNNYILKNISNNESDENTLISLSLVVFNPVYCQFEKETELIEYGTKELLSYDQENLDIFLDSIYPIFEIYKKYK